MGNLDIKGNSTEKDKDMTNYYKDEQTLFEKAKYFIEKIIWVKQGEEGKVEEGEDIDKKVFSIFEDAADNFKDLYKAVALAPYLQELIPSWEKEIDMVNEGFDIDRLGKFLGGKEWYSLCKRGIKKLLEEGVSKEDIVSKLKVYFLGSSVKSDKEHYGLTFEEYLKKRDESKKQS